MDIIQKLEGSHSNFSRLEIPDSPAKIIILGSLGDSGTDRSGGKNQERTLSSVKNNSMTIKFLVSQLGEIIIQPSVSVYYRVYPTYEEQKKYVEQYCDTESDVVQLARIWKRANFDLISANVTLSEQEQKLPILFKNNIEIIKADPEIWKGGNEINIESLVAPAAYYKKIDQLKTKFPAFDWKGSIDISSEHFDQNGTTTHLISLTFTNDTEETHNYETFLFNCHITVELKDTQIENFHYKYDYEDSTYFYNSYLRCLNCHADYDPHSHTIKTKHYAKFRQEKILPKIDIDNISFGFDDLDRNPMKILNQFDDYINNKLIRYKDDQMYQSDDEFRAKTEQLLNLYSRYKDGLNILENNPNALTAFRLMNRAFSKAIDYLGWRGFQIFFIVSLIPDIIDKQLRRDICDVLHVDTGGGKSEAYFGCVLFSAFWDRMNGKSFGTTAITRFPLRMLSIQQLERIARLMIWAEQIRQEEQINGEPFSVGYYVGTSDEFPRHSHTLIKRIQKETDDGNKPIGKIIDTCPICKEPVYLEVKPERYIIHKCGGCDKEFQLFFTNEEIYRFIPTFIVSTVDKLAGISSNRRVKNLFGGKLDQCGARHGFIPRNDSCEVTIDKDKCDGSNEKFDISFSTAPTLIIQDEMHLIREGFGTIDSHFESLIETVQVKLSGYRPKNIAMTATMTGAKQQIMHLYHKDICVFPGASPKGKGTDDIFFEYGKTGNHNVAHRLIIGLKPNLRDNQFASLLTMKYISEFIQCVENDLKKYSKLLDINIKELTPLTTLYKRILTYHNKKSDVHSLNYYLEAVVNSKLTDYKIIPKILTGDNTLDDIKETITLVQNYYSDPSNKNSILSVSATNVVSHGVDISEWNLMIFQGIPRGTAEYIQALSRVGRRDLGIVFVWFYPNRARDLSYYQNFEDYHTILNHKVEHVPLCRWATLGFKETFTSIFNAAILNYFSSIESQPIYKVEQVNTLFKTEEKRLDLINFIIDAYYANSCMTGAQYFKNKIPGEVERRLNYLINYTGGEKNFFPNALKDSDIKEYKTQYGMRGIQDEIILTPSNFDIPVLEKTLKDGL